MNKYEKIPGGYLVVDNTTIYEVDMECYQCLSEEEREFVFDDRERRYGQRNNRETAGVKRSEQVF